MLTAQDVSRCRSEFPALARQQDGRPVIYLDGPAGTQVPRAVAEAIAGYLLQHNANHGGLFLTSRESDALLEEAHRAMAEFLGAGDPAEISFGPNMTSMTFALSRALARTWAPGDNVVVTRLDHDANVSPWVLAAAEAGAEVRHVEICRDDCTLNEQDLRRKLSPRTRLVAVGCASNATGTVNPVKRICRRAHDVGALVFLDAVHYAPHRLPDVRDWDCDFLCCSAYKFFGPHVGVLWGRRHLLEALPAYKVRPAPDSLPGKWMTGTQNHEGIAGVLAAVDYLAALGRRLAGAAELPRREALAAAFAAISAYERELARQLLEGLAAIPQLRVWGITPTERWEERVATVSITHAHTSPRQLAERLASQGIFTWHGNYYALPLTEALGLEPDGMLRIGLVHYNTPQEVDRLLRCLRDDLPN
jgi:cysteine desulfurase family protein (TIGR01976 family)